MSQVASISLGLIARDSAATIGACLDSVRPFVQHIIVGVDETTTDETANVAQEHGADLVTPIVVSEWHECPQHGRVLAQHFAKARNQVLALQDKTCDFLMWLDSDDVLENGAELAPLLAGMPADSCGLWLPYVYGHVNGVANTLFDRERILRSSVGWEWRHRVHETVSPLTEPARWIRSDAVRIVHQASGHKTESSATRNLRLLEIDLEEDGEQPRTVFYIANSHFALNDMPAAIHWYERLTAFGKEANPYELWQSYVYLSLAYERIGDLDGATQAAFGAIDVAPYHPEPMFRLASVYQQTGDFDKCQYWTEQGRKAKKPPFFVFANPLDYSYNNRMVLADAYAAQGLIPAARRELEAANAVLPTEKIGEAIGKYRAIESAAEAESTPAYLSSALKHVCSLLKGMVEEPVEEAVDDGTGITPEEEMSLKAEMDELKSARKALGQTLLSVAGVRMGMN